MVLSEGFEEGADGVGDIPVEGFVFDEGLDVFKGIVEFAGGLDGEPFDDDEGFMFPFFVEGVDGFGTLWAVDVDEKP